MLTSGLLSDRRVRRLTLIAVAVLAVGVGIKCKGKADDNGSAVVRWLPQFRDLVQGQNVYEYTMFPYPPLIGLVLSPLALLPPSGAALVWYAAKLGMTGLALAWAVRLVREPGVAVPQWVVSLALLLSLRPILSDLQHGNINLLILFLIIASLWLFRRGHDVLSGLVLALGITFKLTPALFLPYFLYKRAWKTAGATMAGVILFLFIVPGLYAGPVRNLQMLRSWAALMLKPYVLHGEVGAAEVNQSLVGVASRLLTHTPAFDPYNPARRGYINVLDLDPALTGWIVKGMSVAILGLLAWLCRTPIARRDDWRLAAEYSLVLLAMLFISERSWKHHYVTLLLPLLVLCYYGAIHLKPGRDRWLLAGSLGLATLLQASTSDALRLVIASGLWILEYLGLMAPTSSGARQLIGKLAVKYALAYGMFLLSGVVIFIAVAIVLRKSRTVPVCPGPGATAAPSIQNAPRRREVVRAHR